MNNPTSWSDGTDTKPIIEGNPDDESDNYAEWY